MTNPSDPAATPQGAPKPQGGPIEVPGYRVLKMLGRGGMGTVYHAVQESLEREVALKVLAPQIATKPKAIQNFLKEARTAAQVGHPNVITVFDVGQMGETLFMAMEYIAGGDAWQLLESRGGKLSENDALAIIRDACKGLVAIHESKLVHRDIKPHNIFLSRHGAKLGDLGLACASTDDNGRPNQTVGTPHYMSPEQAAGSDDLDIRGDIYSLGATFFALMCGNPPFDGGTSWAVISAVMNDPIPDPRELAQVSEGAAEIMERCMAKDPSRRYQTPEDLLQAIRELEASGFQDSMGRPKTQHLSDRLVRQALDGASFPNEQQDAAAVASAGLASADIVDDPAALGRIYSSSLDDTQYYQPAGTKIGDYRLKSPLGETATGFVYRATEISTQRPVRLEIVRSEYNNDDEFIGGLRQKALKHAMVLHPNVCELIGVEDENGQHFIVHDLPGDRTLASWVAAEGRLDWEEAVTLLRECIDGTEALHDAGLVHRNIEPCNIYITEEGTPKLGPISFEPAVGGGNFRKTQSSSYLIALAHQSPEQVLGEAEPGPPTDIYALGAITYTAISGRVPFTSDSSFDLYHAIIAGGPPSLQGLVGGLPPQLYVLVDQAMARTPDERIATTDALKDAALAVGVGLKLKERLKSIGQGELLTDSSLADLVTLARIAKVGDEDLAEMKRACALIALREQSAEAWGAIKTLFSDQWLGEKADLILTWLHALRLDTPKTTLRVANVGGDFGSIQAAVTAAKPGTRILISPGTYDESVVVDKPLYLLGDGLNNQAVLKSTSGVPLTISGPGVVVARLTVQCQVRGADAAMLVNNSSPLILNCALGSAASHAMVVSGPQSRVLAADTRFAQSAGNGVILMDQAQATLHHCDISDNAGVGLVCARNAMPAMYFTRCHKNKMGGSLFRDGAGGSITNCVFSSNGKAGILCRAAGDLQIEQSRIHSNAGPGAAFGDGGAGTMINCELANNQSANLYIANGSNPSVNACQIVKGRAEGVHIAKGGKGLIEECQISGNMGYAVALAEETSPVLRRCVIEHGRAWGLVAAEGAGGEVEACSLKGEQDKQLHLKPGHKIYLH